MSVTTGPHHSRWFQTKLHTPPHSPIDVGSWTTSTATTNTSSSATPSTLNVLRTRSPSAPSPLNHTSTTTSVLTGHVPGRSTSSAPSTRATSGFPWPIAPQHYEARPYPEARSYPDYFDQSAFTQLAYHPSDYLFGQGDGPFGQPTTSRGSARFPVTPLAHHHSQPNLHSHAPPSNGRPLSYVHESDEGSASSSASDAGYGASRLASKSMSDVHQTSSGKNGELSRFVDVARVNASLDRYRQARGYRRLAQELRIAVWRGVLVPHSGRGSCAPRSSPERHRIPRDSSAQVSLFPLACRLA